MKNYFVACVPIYRVIFGNISLQSKLISWIMYYQIWELINNWFVLETFDNDGY